MFQTRSEENGIRRLASMKEAIRQSEVDPTIWKISFTLETGERIRLVKNNYGIWEMQNIDIIERVK